MKALIPVDGSELALKTVQEAAALLDKQNSDIYLLTVLVPVTSEVPWGFYMAEEQEAANVILQQAETIAREAGLHVARTDATVAEEAASAICAYAAESNIDLIVMGSHGYRGLAKTLIGSVSEAVFQHAEPPVMLIRHGKTQALEISHPDQLHFKPIR